MKQQQTKIKTFQIRYRFIIESNNYYYKQRLISQYNDKIHSLRRTKDYIHNIIHCCNATINFNQKNEMSLFIQIIHMIMNIFLRNRLKRNTIKLFEECIKDKYNNEFTIINYLNEVMKNNTYFE